MRAGNLDRIITVQAAEISEPDENRNVTEGWGEARTLRAQIIQAATDEFLRASGESSEETVVFRTHFVDGITTAHRVTYQGRPFNIRETKEIGRREGLELRCQEDRP